MKLINFYESKELNELLVQMGASLQLMSGSNSWENLDNEKLRELIRTGEVEIDLERLEIVDKVFEFNGRKVIVYIRDQIERYFEQGYKFHLTTCNTISNAFQNKRNSRYIISLRTDGVFKVNLMDDGRIKRKDLEIELKVCKQCLATINYKGYSNIYGNTSSKFKIYSEFSLDEYFKQFKSSSLNTTLFDNANSAPENTYPPNWSVFSENIKRRDGYKCTECEVDMSSPNLRKYAHVHHIDANKANNSLSNLITLCIRCHAEKPMHEHLKLTPEYREFINLGLNS